MELKFNVGEIALFSQIVLDGMFNSLKEFIRNIPTTNTKGRDTIMSLEFASGGEVAEWQVLGVRVVNEEIEYCASYDFFEKERDYTEEELDGNYDWFSLRNSDNYYIQTMYNIWESINEYVE